MRQLAIQARVRLTDMLKRSEIAAPDRRAVIERFKQVDVSSYRMRQQNNAVGLLSAGFDRLSHSSVRTDQVSAAPQKHDAVTKIRAFVHHINVDRGLGEGIHRSRKNQTIANISLIRDEHRFGSCELREEVLDVVSHRDRQCLHARFSPDWPSSCFIIIRSGKNPPEPCQEKMWRKSGTLGRQRLASKKTFITGTLYSESRNRVTPIVGNSARKRCANHAQFVDPRLLHQFG